MIQKKEDEEKKNFIWKTFDVVGEAFLCRSILFAFALDKLFEWWCFFVKQKAENERQREQKN